MFGTAISRFTDVRFKHSSNNSYSLLFQNKNKIFRQARGRSINK